MKILIKYFALNYKKFMKPLTLGRKKMAKIKKKNLKESHCDSKDFFISFP